MSAGDAIGIFLLCGVGMVASYFLGRMDERIASLEMMRKLAESIVHFCQRDQ